MVISNSTGLCIDFLENGSIKQIEAGPIRISLKPATLFSQSGANIYLRKRSEPGKFIALTGPGSVSRFRIAHDEYFASGCWEGLFYTCRLQLSQQGMSWMWIVDIINQSGNPVEIDLIYLQDVGLKPLNGGLVNEYYVSQYLERIVLEDQRYGSVICCRQNMRESVGHPWLILAAGNGATSGSTDGMQFFGKTYRETGIPEGLLSEKLSGNYAGESSIVALQETPSILLADGHHRSIFGARYLHDHPFATSAEDLQLVSELFTGFPETVPDQVEIPMIQSEKNLFNTSPFFLVDDLTGSELDHFFGDERRHSVENEGRLLSFFCGDHTHVMLRSKEILADRPHAHIMQAKAGFVPDEDIMSTTAFAFGVFNSHISQGNTNFNVLLSVCTSQFNCAPQSGQRIFVLIEGRYYLLGVPSAFEMGLNYCRWIYKQGDQCFQVRTWTSPGTPRVNMDFRVLAGPDISLLITHDFDTLNAWKMVSGDSTGEFLAIPAPGSMVAGKFPNARFRLIVNSLASDFSACGEDALFTEGHLAGGSLFVLDIGHTKGFCMSFIGETRSEADLSRIEDPDLQWRSDTLDAGSYWQSLSLGLSLHGGNSDLAAIREILPWYGMNAMTHFLTPYGLEQFSGAAWGTRDVSQGPVDLLLTMQKYAEAKQVLRTIFSNQNPDGGWPQWWMFDSFGHIRAKDSHGDVFYWVLIALSSYVKVTGDLKILDEEVPYYRLEGAEESEFKPVSEHVDRLIRMIIDSFIPGTSLVPFGGGDWNDSLQPVGGDLAERLVSSWTVEMNYQAFRQYTAIYELAGDRVKADKLQEVCNNIRNDFNKFLIKDNVVAGYGLVNEDRSFSVMLHPGDSVTGVNYSLLPMERGILSEIFTPEQAAHHQGLIEKYLKGPDGARLMDRPLRYQGGIQKIFQRAESSTFFGREIGLMYVHEHIRYAESLAMTGQADAFVKALRQAIPVSYSDFVPCGDVRQSNCYYSSSDVAFKTRYEADELYTEISSGKIMLRGGWRVYSSGPGIFISLIINRLLGIRFEFSNLLIDPVIPVSMDGLTATLEIFDRSVTFRYTVRESGFSPKFIEINDIPIQFEHAQNTYRAGGAIVPVGLFLSKLNSVSNIIEIRL